MKKRTYIIGGLVLVLLIAGLFVYQTVFVFPATNATQPDAGVFVIRSQANGDMIRPAGAQAEDGIAMEMFTPRPWTCVAWQFQPQGTGTFRLKNIFSGKTFAASDTLNRVSQSAIQATIPRDGTVSPKYTFIRMDDSTYRIENAAGLCLTANTKETDGSVKLVFSPWQSSANQKWEVLKAPAKLIGPVAMK